MSFLKLYFISVKANIKLFDISSTTNLDSYILFPYTIIDEDAAIFSTVVCGKSVMELFITSDDPNENCILYK